MAPNREINDPAQTLASLQSEKNMEVTPGSKWRDIQNPSDTLVVNRVERTLVFVDWDGDDAATGVYFLIAFKSEFEPLDPVTVGSVWRVMGDEERTFVVTKTHGELACVLWDNGAIGWWSFGSFVDNFEPMAN